jgi:anti-sigma B factor antagonist
MDSSGLGVLVSCLRKAVVKGGDIRLAALAPKVRMLLELTRVDKVFQTFVKVEDALTSFIDYPPGQSGMI